MTRILIYSHDTFGLGNISRMLAIATHMAESLRDTSVLIVSGSPMLHGFRIAPQIDYVKLPTVSRTAREGYSTRSLGLEADDTFEMRANLLLATVADFRPDIIVVDKKPFGVENELEGALYYAKTNLPRVRLVLVLRDILDRPDATIRSWRAGHYSSAIERFYDLVLVLGSPQIFDPRREYQLPDAVKRKMQFCGYLRRPRGARTRAELRSELGVPHDGRLVLVTPGGGQDGRHILDAYVAALPHLHADPRLHSLIVTGPELAPADRRQIERAVGHRSGVHVREFTDDMMSCLDAADLVVCMAGYNTICEIATLRKRAVVVPRVRPVEEQWIRAERLAGAEIVSVLHPDGLCPEALARAVADGLSRPDPAGPGLDLDGLTRVTGHIAALARRAEPSPGPAPMRPVDLLALRVMGPPAVA